LIEFNKQHEKAMLKYGQAVLGASEATSGSLKEAEYIHSLEYNLYHASQRGIDYALETYHLDMLIFPHEQGSIISAMLGYPSIAMPAGYTSSGEPVGITFAGAAYSEPALIEAAYAYERLTKYRKAPVLEKE